MAGHIKVGCMDYDLEKDIASANSPASGVRSFLKKLSKGRRYETAGKVAYIKLDVLGKTCGLVIRKR